MNLAAPAVQAGVCDSLPGPAAAACSAAGGVGDLVDGAVSGVTSTAVAGIATAFTEAAGHFLGALSSAITSTTQVDIGSDWFVAPATPLEGIYAAVTRRTIDDKNPDGWVPAQKITVEEALRAYTTNGAYASFDESRKGTLAAGKLADLVLIDRDLFSIPAEEIRNAKVVATIVGGKVVSGAWPAATQ